LSAATLAPRELPQRLKLLIFSGLSSGIGLPFLWILSFGNAKESISPKGRNAFKVSSPRKQKCKNAKKKLAASAKYEI
jgi:hypothetical protein